MKLHFRSFHGSTQRPSPVAKDSENIISIVTPWNADSATSEKLIQDFRDIYFSLSQDKDSTRPFDHLSSLSIEENNVHAALLHINQQLFQKTNKEELKLGFEVLFMVQVSHQIIFAQVGHPSLYLSRNHLPLQSIGKSYSSIPSLPADLLGVFKDINVSVNSFKAQDLDQIFLVSRNWIPTSFLNSKDRSLETLGDLLAEDDAKEPFWLGQVEF